MRNPHGIAGEFLSEWFGAEDTFALLLRHADPSRTRQRIIRQGDLLKSNYLGWLAHENAHGANVYFSVNSLLPDATKRAKNAIAEARALYLDLDEDGDRKLAAIRASDSVPSPSIVIRTSPGKYQILWRMHGFTIPEQEVMLKTVAATFGGDRACTDCARVLRLPGFFNRKYTPACLVTLAHDGIQTVYSPDDFRLEMPSLSLADSGSVNVNRPLGNATQSENDWAWVMPTATGTTIFYPLTNALCSLRRNYGKSRAQRCCRPAHGRQVQPTSLRTGPATGSASQADRWPATDRAGQGETGRAASLCHPPARYRQ